MFAVGGAGAQAELVDQFLPSLRPLIQEGRLRLQLVAGTRPEVHRVFADAGPTFRPFDSPQGFTGTPHPTGVPDQFQGAYVAQTDITVESLLGPTDPWLAPGATVTTGNNVEAYLDISGTDGFNGTDIRGAISGAGQFLYTFDPAAATMVPLER